MDSSTRITALLSLYIIVYKKREEIVLVVEWQGLYRPSTPYLELRECHFSQQV